MDNNYYLHFRQQKMFINAFALLMLLLLESVPLSDQRRLPRGVHIQGRQRRSPSTNDVTAKPLSEEEFELSLYQRKNI